LSACLFTCLTTFERLEAKRRSAWPLNFATITNSPVRCAFSGSKECLPSAPGCSFYLHDYGRLLHVTKPYRCIIFWIDTFCIRRHKLFQRKLIFQVKQTLVCPYGDYIIHGSLFLSLDCKYTLKHNDYAPVSIPIIIECKKHASAIIVAWHQKSTPNHLAFVVCFKRATQNHTPKQAVLFKVHSKYSNRAVTLIHV